jgi:hypothetical protein
MYDPHSTSLLHCGVAYCPEYRADNSAFCRAHRLKKNRKGLILRAPVFARRAIGNPSVAGRLGSLSFLVGKS